MEMLAASDLRGDDLRVLLLLIARLNFENLISLVQTAIADKLGMQKQNINRSIKHLVDIGCLLEGPRISRSRTYRMNPPTWKDSGNGHQKALRASEKVKAAGLTVHLGGKASEDSDAPLRAELEVKGQIRIID